MDRGVGIDGVRGGDGGGEAAVGDASAGRRGRGRRRRRRRSVALQQALVQQFQFALARRDQLLKLLVFLRIGG